jgi:hypothetical protein
MLSEKLATLKDMDMAKQAVTKEKDQALDH